MQNKSGSNSLLMALLVIIILIGAGLFVLNLLKGTRQEAEVIIENGKIEITGQYGITYNLADVEELLIKEGIPRIKRKVNGAGLGLIKTLTLTIDGKEQSYEFSVPNLDRSLPSMLNSPVGWLQVPPEFNNLLESLCEYPDYSTSIDGKDRDLLDEYGLTPAFLISQTEIELPTDLLHRAGEFPAVLYWAYNNELNKAIGLDIQKALGQKVDVRLYKILELLPDYMRPRREAGRAVVVHCNDAIIGAWLDAGRHYGFACSLNRKTHEEITDKSWDEWIVSHIDFDYPLEKELALKSPEEIIHTYYEAVNNKDNQRAYACLSRKNYSSYLFSNMDNKYLMNSDYKLNDGLENITSAAVVKIESYPPDSEHSGNILSYTVTVDIEVKEPLTYDSGRQFRFIKLQQESIEGGWRIASIGTGP